jgi:hypothetical protein
MSTHNLTSQQYNGHGTRSVRSRSREFIRRLTDRVAASRSDRDRPRSDRDRSRLNRDRPAHLYIKLTYYYGFTLPSPNLAWRARPAHFFHSLRLWSADNASSGRSLKNASRFAGGAYIVLYVCAPTLPRELVTHT